MPQVKHWLSTKGYFFGRVGGQVVSMHAFYSNSPSSNLAEVYNIFVKIAAEKDENKQKEAMVGPFIFASR